MSRLAGELRELIGRRRAYFRNDEQKIAEENLDLNTFSYTEGKLPIIDVLSAQVTWIQSYSSLIQTWLQQKVSLADYNKAIGKQ